LRTVLQTIVSRIRWRIPWNALVVQRIFALCAGYEDLNDHDALRRDPVFEIAVGESLAGRCTLSRVENVSAAPRASFTKVL